MTRRIALLTTLLVLALAAPAGAQSGAFGPLPPPEATPTATATPADTGTETGRNVLFIIGGALILGFAVMGWMIMRDARSASDRVGDGVDHDKVRSEALHKRQQADKARARKKTRAQKHARKAQRNR